MNKADAYLATVTKQTGTNQYVIVILKEKDSKFHDIRTDM